MGSTYNEFGVIFGKNLCLAFAIEFFNILGSTQLHLKLHARVYEPIVNNKILLGTYLIFTIHGKMGTSTLLIVILLKE